ncbi:MAG: hypothetical protein WBR26_05230 [Candidatus Acidiferrum sp.]
MNIPWNVSSARFAFVTALFVSLSVLASTTPAQTPQGHEVTKVVAHLPLENIHVNQMFLEKRGEKYFLFLHRPNKDAFALVDVTNPSKPVLVNREEMKGYAPIQPPEGNSVVAISVVPDGAEHPAPTPTYTLQLLNLANPKDVKVLKTFKGVTAFTPDDGRKLVYLVNSEGLWIVSHHMTRPLPLCNSASSLNPMPDCQ